jgi:hypothetical protein
MDKEVDVSASHSMGLFRRAALQARIDALRHGGGPQPPAVASLEADGPAERPPIPREPRSGRTGQIFS